MKKIYDVKGMTCAACVSHVEKACLSVGGVESAGANLLTGKVTVTGDYNEENLSRAVEKAGYRLETGNVNKKTEETGHSELKSMGFRLKFSFCFLLPLMYLSMGHMMFGAPIPSILSGQENAAVYVLTQLLLTLPVLYVNRIFFERGLRSLLHGAPNMDSLIAVGSGASVLYGLFALYCIGYGLGHGDMEIVDTYRNDLYFESAAMILTLITMGKYLETKSRKKTGAAIEKLLKLVPETALVMRDGQETTIQASSLSKGDVVLLRPGMRIPADGVIISGRLSADQSALTGESVPAEKAVGDQVMCASVCVNGFASVRVEKTGEDTTLSQMIHLVEEAAASKAPISRLADKIAGIFVPCVLGISAIVLAVWLFFGQDFPFALTRCISVLVISCPCALGLATPVAVMVGTGKGAQMGILFKSGEAIELLNRVDTVVLDKTGTITSGKMHVTEMIELSPMLLSVAGGLEQGSNHPFALAIAEKAADFPLLPMENYQVLEGLGLSAEADGVLCLGGNEQLMQREGIDLSAVRQRVQDKAGDAAPIFFAYGGELLGVIYCADSVKETSPDAIAEFKKLGRQVIMLTGDNEKTAARIASQTGIDSFHAHVLPADKQKIIAELQKEGHRVAMIGDGINDAPALVQADVGLAIGAGSDIALESGDVVLMKSSLADAADALRLSRETLKRIKMGLFWAFFYNSIGIPVAAGVLYPFFGILMNPMLSAVCMSLSSVCVVSNALLINRFHASGRENIKKTEKQIFRVDGMMCGHCEKTVQDALLALPFVTEARADYKKGEVLVTLFEDGDINAVRETIKNHGYQPLF